MALLRFDPSVAFMGFHSYFHLAPSPSLCCNLKGPQTYLFNSQISLTEFFLKCFLRFFLYFLHYARNILKKSVRL